MHQHRLRRHDAVVDAADAMHADEAVHHLAHHQADLIHVRRQHNTQGGLLLAGREFRGDQAAEAVGSQRIRERPPGVPEQRAQGPFVAGGGVGLHHLAQMCVQVKHDCLLRAGT